MGHVIFDIACLLAGMVVGMYYNDMIDDAIEVFFNDMPTETSID